MNEGTMGLRCDEVRNRFSAFFEGDLSRSEQTDLREHLNRCSACQEEFARFEKTLRVLHAVEEIEVPEGLLPGIYEKVEDRHKEIPREAYRLKWKLPLQAVAMVAIVFLTLYLSKMMPSGPMRMEATKEPKSSSEEGKGEERKSPAEIKVVPFEGQNLDREPPPKESAQQNRRPAAGIPSSEGAGRRKGFERPPEVFQAGKAERERGVAVTEETQPSTSARQPAATPLPSTPPGLAGAPRPSLDETKHEEEPTTTKAKGEGAIAKKTASHELIPSEEFVLKSSDRTKSISEIHELADRFGAEVLTTEKSSLLISLPRSVLPEFKKDLEGMGVRAKVQQAASSKTEIAGRVGDGRARIKEGEEERKDIGKLGAIPDTRVIIRVILMGE